MRPETASVTRRHALKGAGTMFVAASLAGCGDVGDGDGGDENGTDGGDGTDDGGESPTEGVGNETGIDMTNEFSFDPDEITVGVGTRVVWRNASDTGHTVTAYDRNFPEDAQYFASGDFESEETARENYQEDDIPESGEIPPGETFEYTFETPGTYEYFCIPHESDMQGTITIEE